MHTLTKISEVRKTVKEWKKHGYSVGFVPTMGALHRGHQSLIERAVEECDRVVVSVFVNPTQFGPKEDFNCYPRTLEVDQELCKKNGVDVLFAPTVSEMYLQGQNIEEIPHTSDLLSGKNITTVVPPSSYVDKLCGKSRPGHFNGVATVVLKLFNIVQPDKAFFGEKDAQQLIIIKKLCADLNVPVEIIGCPIVRDDDGLALSSRNTYLSPEARTKALTLSKVLKKVEELYNSGQNDKDTVLNEAKKLLDPEMQLEYLEVYDINTLAELKQLQTGSLVAIAARIDGVRLIDNLIIR